MTRAEYLNQIDKLYDEGKIDYDTYVAMNESVDLLDFNGDSRFPDTYAEIDYEDMDSIEAYEGCRFDDMNYLRHFER